MSGELTEQTEVAAAALFRTLNPRAGDYETLPAELRHKYAELALPTVVALHERGMIKAEGI